MKPRRKGCKKYIPPVVLDEIDDIMREDRVYKRADAFKELAKYARVGREMNRIMKWDFRRKMTLPPVDYYDKKKHKKR